MTTFGYPDWDDQVRVDHPIDRVMIETRTGTFRGFLVVSVTGHYSTDDPEPVSRRVAEAFVVLSPGKPEMDWRVFGPGNDELAQEVVDTSDVDKRQPPEAALVLSHVLCFAYAEAVGRR